LIALLEADPEAPPGVIVEVLAGMGIPFSHLRLHAGEAPGPLAEFSGAIILGGGMHADEESKHPFLADLKTLIRSAARTNFPLLGICLGGQLIAATLGGRLNHDRDGEKGIARVRLTGQGGTDPLFCGLPEEFVTFQWHVDSFTIPPDAVALAGSERCPAQAFRYGSTVYGVQFHPEVDPPTATSWCLEEGDLALSDAFREFAADHGASGRLILRNFAKLAFGGS